MYSSAPPPIDFEAYKAKISTPGVVEKFEQEYKTISYPEAVAEELAEIKEQHAAMVRPVCVWVRVCVCGWCTHQ